MPNDNMNMDEIRIIILGSCVTRDIFRIERNGVNIVDYFARTSIKSLISPPIEIDQDEIVLSSAFQKRMVLRDFSKDFWNVVGKSPYDLLLIDFIDERFNVYSYKNSIITKTNELVQSEFPAHHDKELIEKQRKDVSTIEMTDDISRFVMRLSEIVPPSNVILIKAFWAEKYLDKDGNLRFFDKSTKFSLENIRVANSKLNEYYRQFVKSNPNCHIIETNAPVADINHVWGLSPFHYQENWYRETRAMIDLVARSLHSP